MNIYEAMRPVSRGDLTRFEGTYGIEIETETVNEYPRPEMRYWRTEPDGSLRNFGVEYILVHPLSMESLPVALKEFQDTTKDIQFIEEPVSASVHVHINFLNDTFQTLANFFTIYTLVENLLVRFSGPDRLSNLFCLPIRDAEVIIDYMLNIYSSVANSRERFRGFRLDENRMKYGAINLASLSSRGSIEIRSFRGTTDTNLIQEWVSILDSLLNYSRRCNNPYDVIQHWRDSDVEILDHILGNKADNLRVDGYRDLMVENQFYASRLASYMKDWTNFGKFKKGLNKKSKKEMRDNRNQMAIEMFDEPYDGLNDEQRFAVDEALEREVHPVAEDEDFNDGDDDLENAGDWQPVNMDAMNAGAGPRNVFLNNIRFGEG